MKDEQWDAIVHCHMTAPFKVCRAAGRVMREAAKAEKLADPAARAVDRCVINVASTSGLHGNVGQANYAAAKAGVIGLTKTLAKEWGPLGIRCNAVAFGMISTRMTADVSVTGESITVGGVTVPQGLPPGAAAMWKDPATVRAIIPLARAGEPEEARDMYCFYMPAQWVMPWLQWAAGEKMCHFPPGRRRRAHDGLAVRELRHWPHPRDHGRVRHLAIHTSGNIRAQRHSACHPGFLCVSAARSTNAGAPPRKGNWGGGPVRALRGPCVADGWQALCKIQCMSRLVRVGAPAPAFFVDSPAGHCGGVTSTEMEIRGWASGVRCVAGRFAVC